MEIFFERNEKIRSMYKNGVVVREIADMFNISRTHVYNIVLDTQKNWNNIRKAVFIRDENKCQMMIKCKKDKSKKLCVHHIDENRSNNKMRNLITLCSNCHNYYHSKLINGDNFDDLYNIGKMCVEDKKTQKELSRLFQTNKNFIQRAVKFYNYSKKHGKFHLVEEIPNNLLKEHLYEKIKSQRDQRT